MWSPVPQLSCRRARGLNPSSAKTTSANQDIPAVARFLFIICKKPVPAVSVVPVDTDLFHNTLLLQSNMAFRSPALQEFQCRTLWPTSLAAPKIPKDRKLPLRLGEITSPVLLLSTTPVHLKCSSNSKGCLHGTCETKEKCLTELPYNTLLLDTDPANNRLTFSDRSSACGFAPLSLLQHLKKTKAKDTC